MQTPGEYVESLVASEESVLFHPERGEDVRSAYGEIGGFFCVATDAPTTWRQLSLIVFSCCCRSLASIHDLALNNYGNCLNAQFGSTS